MVVLFIGGLDICFDEFNYHDSMQAHLREGIGDFQCIKIQLDSEACKKQTKEMNKHGHSIFRVCVF